MTSALLQPADLPAVYQVPAKPPSCAIPALLRGPKAEALLRGPKGDALPRTAPTPDALHTPRVAINFAAVHADIAAERATDALIDAEDLLGELQSRLRDLRGMPPSTAALLFGSDAAWRQALARVAVAAGRQLTGVEALRAAVGHRLRAPAQAVAVEEAARDAGGADEGISDASAAGANVSGADASGANAYVDASANASNANASNAAASFARPSNPNTPAGSAANATPAARVHFDLNEIARPIASGTRVQWTGD